MPAREPQGEGACLCDQRGRGDSSLALWMEQKRTDLALCVGACKLVGDAYITQRWERASALKEDIICHHRVKESVVGGALSQ